MMTLTIILTLAFLAHCLEVGIDAYRRLKGHYPKSYYKRYIQSKGWYQKRKQRLKIDNYKCQGENCKGDDSVLHVHHKTYIRLGNESMSDLITLCRTCHVNLHKRKKRK